MLADYQAALRIASERDLGMALFPFKVGVALLTRAVELVK